MYVLATTVDFRLKRNIHKICGQNYKHKYVVASTTKLHCSSKTKILRKLSLKQRVQGEYPDVNK